MIEPSGANGIRYANRINGTLLPLEIGGDWVYVAASSFGQYTGGCVCEEVHPIRYL